MKIYIRYLDHEGMLRTKTFKMKGYKKIISVRYTGVV